MIFNVILKLLTDDGRQLIRSIELSFVPMNEHVIYDAQRQIADKIERVSYRLDLGLFECSVKPANIISIEQRRDHNWRINAGWIREEEFTYPIVQSLDNSPRNKIILVTRTPNKILFMEVYLNFNPSKGIFLVDPAKAIDDQITALSYSAGKNFIECQLTSIDEENADKRVKAGWNCKERDWKA